VLPLQVAWASASPGKGVAWVRGQQVQLPDASASAPVTAVDATSSGANALALAYATAAHPGRLLLACVPGDWSHAAAASRALPCSRAGDLALGEGCRLARVAWDASSCAARLAAVTLAGDGAAATAICRWDGAHLTLAAGPGAAADGGGGLRPPGLPDLAWARDGTWLCLRTPDGRCSLLNPDSLQPLAQPLLPPGAGSSDGNAPGGAPVAASCSAAAAVAASPHSVCLASVSDGRLVLWGVPAAASAMPPGSSAAQWVAARLAWVLVSGSCAGAWDALQLLARMAGCGGGDDLAACWQALALVDAVVHGGWAQTAASGRAAGPRTRTLPAPRTAASPALFTPQPPARTPAPGTAPPGPDSHHPPSAGERMLCSHSQLPPPHHERRVGPPEAGSCHAAARDRGRAPGQRPAHAHHADASGGGHAASRASLHAGALGASAGGESRARALRGGGGGLLFNRS